MIQGFINNGVAEFLGIPYAEPPVGNLRWKPSKKHEPWAGVLKTTAYGPTCAQIVTLGVFAGPANNNEDCLYLNVFTPNLDPSARLPVIFWIHGGGNVDGESNDYDASKLAADGKTVVVTINYRLNLMGFLAHPALDAEGHLFGNYGVLDQQLAMKWVQAQHREVRRRQEQCHRRRPVRRRGQYQHRRHIAACRRPVRPGDHRKRVAVCQLTRCCPGALANGDRLRRRGGLRLRHGRGHRQMSAQPDRRADRSAGGHRERQQRLHSRPDGGRPIIPQHPVQAWHNGQFNHMPMMNGRTSDEANFSLGITEYFTIAAGAADRRAVHRLRQHDLHGAPNATPPGLPYPAGTAAAVLAHYPLSAYASPQLAWDALVSDSADACTTRHINKILYSQVPLYGYEFDDRTAPSYFPKLPGFLFLAYHTSDIQYLFPLYHGGPAPPSVIHLLNNKQQDLSDQLVAAWTNFAWTGNPNGLGNYPWPRFNNSPIKATYLSREYPGPFDLHRPAILGASSVRFLGYNPSLYLRAELLRQKERTIENGK